MLKDDVMLIHGEPCGRGRAIAWVAARKGARLVLASHLLGVFYGMKYQIAAMRPSVPGSCAMGEHDLVAPWGGDLAR